MTDTNITQQIELINKKLDFITSEMYEQRNRRMFFSDLQADLMKISDSAMQEYSKKLNGMSQYLMVDDFIYMAKKLLLNINNFTKLIDIIENIMDFSESFVPLTKEMFANIQIKLTEVEKLGYFDLFKILIDRMGDLMQTTSKEELIVLGNNIIAFLRAGKNTSLDFSTSNKSIFYLMKEVNSRELKGVISTIIQLVNNFDKERKAL